MTELRTLLGGLCAASLLAACGGEAEVRSPAAERTVETPAPTTGSEASYGSGDMDMDAKMMSKTFSVMNSSGNSIGDVTITDTADGVAVMLDVTSIPAGSHAIHFHEVGTCDGPDFKSAGGHYNPAGVNHGFEAPSPNTHAGDMRNFDAPQSGVVKTTLENERVSLSERDGFAPLFDSDNTALIIHASADDYKSQPSGAAGARIACAVIAG